MLIANAVASKRRLVGIVVVSRILLLLLMGISCHLIPEHNPGDDVLRFDLRLDQANPCFCLKGHDCDPFRGKGLSHKRGDKTCAKHSRTVVANSRTIALYRFLLTPITKWDAARFLTLAADSNVRNPVQCRKKDKNCKDPFRFSEQAHAFLPFFPLCIRATANVLLRWLPTSVLPPTYEGVLALAACMLNAACFTLATLALFDLTAQVSGSENIAQAVSLVFIINPATIFFSTAYSESLFAMLTFGGYALAARRLTWLAVLPWMAASYTRSNGTMNAAWLIVRGLASMIHRRQSLWQLISSLFYHLILASMVAFPVRYHDIEGYQRHCKTLNPTKNKRPTWCSDDHDSVTGFSLYAWTQRHHWNVGLFRYYQWKQIPNFLLAAPILGLGIWGVYLWTYNSVKEYNKGKPVSLRVWMPWAIHSLQQSVSIQNYSSSMTKKREMEQLVTNPLLLGYYAVLAAACFVGLTVAHVQISTRLICSSCPAILWFMTDRVLKQDLMSRAVLTYCALYILLGLIMHVNFLPWT